MRTSFKWKEFELRRFYIASDVGFPAVRYKLMGIEKGGNISTIHEFKRIKDAENALKEWEDHAKEFYL